MRPQVIDIDESSRACTRTAASNPLPAIGVARESAARPARTPARPVARAYREARHNRTPIRAHGVEIRANSDRLRAFARLDVADDVAVLAGARHWYRVD